MILVKTLIIVVVVACIQLVAVAFDATTTTTTIVTTAFQSKTRNRRHVSTNRQPQPQPQPQHISLHHSRTTTTTTTTTQLYGILGRFRKNRKVEQVRPIQVGDRLTDNTVDIERISTTTGSEDSSDSNVVAAEAMSILDVLGPNKALLIGMPGAFTTTCSQRHLPGYVENAKKIKSLGIDTIAVITTNDRFVNQEWAKQQGLITVATPNDEQQQPPITMLCDADGDFIKSIGLAEDMGFGIGIRSKRFVIMTDNGIVTNVFTDEGMEDCSATSAANIIKILTPDPVPGSSSAADGIEIDGKIIVGVVGAIALSIIASTIMGGGGNDTPIPATKAKTTPPPPKSQVQPSKKSSSSDTNFSLINEYLKDNSN